ncbi:MAG: hypothetical protein C5B58_06340 [Acidobacteria bacterium]|nr:MAG: hypothetical protein C5B58_06340 [Acidobacteriota bacterium]
MGSDDIVHRAAHTTICGPRDRSCALARSAKRTAREPRSTRGQIKSPVHTRSLPVDPDPAAPRCGVKPPHRKLAPGPGVSCYLGPLCLHGRTRLANRSRSAASYQVRVQSTPSTSLHPQIYRILPIVSQKMGWYRHGLTRPNTKKEVQTMTGFTPEASPGSFSAVTASRRDYGSQFEILVAVLYHQIVLAQDIVVDGGANAGLHAIPLAQLVHPAGLLIAIEPLPEVFESLRRNLGKWKTELHQLALDSKPGKVQFTVDEEALALSHIHISAELERKDRRTRTITVETARLDDIVGSRKISFIKLDLEGNEFPCLIGSKALIHRDRPYIIFENGRLWSAKCYGYTKDEFFEYFEELQYDIFDMHARQLTPDVWEDKNIAFEFLAAPRERTSRTEQLLGVMKFFWREAACRPEIAQWTDCVRIVCRVEEYMQTYHGASWLKMT